MRTSNFANEAAIKVIGISKPKFAQRCSKVAAQFAAAILQRSRDRILILFDTSAYDAKVDPNDSILSIAERLAKYGGGGTECSLPRLPPTGSVRRASSRVSLSLAITRTKSARFDRCDDGLRSLRCQPAKAGRKEISPKLVNIDLQPYQTLQACERADIRNIGGYSDSMFNVIGALFADNNQLFAAEVEAIEL